MCVNVVCNHFDATFWVSTDMHPDSIERVVQTPKKYIHQLSTPYSIWCTFFSFEIRWGEGKLRDKVLSPKSGPESQKWAWVPKAVFHLYFLTGTGALKIPNSKTWNLKKLKILNSVRLRTDHTWSLAHPPQMLGPTTMMPPPPPLPLTPRVSRGWNAPPQKIPPINLSHFDALPFWFHHDNNFQHCLVWGKKSHWTLNWFDNQPNHPDNQRVS